MKEVKVFLDFNTTEEYKKSILEQVEVKFTDSLVEDCFHVKSEVFVDWEYLISVIGNKNIKFNFIDFYLNEIELDRYKFSGIEYFYSSRSENLELPIVKYKRAISKFNSILFLDRDGIINIDTGYVYEFKEEIIYNDIFPLIKFCNESSIKVAIVTNQAGVARGKYSVSEVELFHDELKEFFSKNGIHFDHVEICPFHKDKGNPPWNFDSLLRKPNPGMLLRAASNLEASLSMSAMIGDKDSDRISIAGPKYFLLEGNYPINSTENVYSSRSQIFSSTKDYLNKILDFS